MSPAPAPTMVAPMMRSVPRLTWIFTKPSVSPSRIARSLSSNWTKKKNPLQLDEALALYIINSRCSVNRLRERWRRIPSTTGVTINPPPPGPKSRRRCHFIKYNAADTTTTTVPAVTHTSSHLCKWLARNAPNGQQRQEFSWRNLLRACTKKSGWHVARPTTKGTRPTTQENKGLPPPAWCMCRKRFSSRPCREGTAQRGPPPAR